MTACPTYQTKHYSVSFTVYSEPTTVLPRVLHCYIAVALRSVASFKLFFYIYMSYTDVIVPHITAAHCTAGILYCTYILITLHSVFITVCQVVQYLKNTSRVFFKNNGIHIIIDIHDLSLLFRIYIKMLSKFKEWGNAVHKTCIESPVHQVLQSVLRLLHFVLWLAE